MAMCGTVVKVRVAVRQPERQSDHQPLQCEWSDHLGHDQTARGSQGSSIGLGGQTTNLCNRGGQTASRDH
jgi:hypothetical protein